MALVTVHRSPTPSTSSDTLSDCCGECLPDDSVTTQDTAHSISETYLTVKGAAVILSSCIGRQQTVKTSNTRDIHRHLDCMYCLLRPCDLIKLAVRLECLQSDNWLRYLTIVSTVGCQSSEESLIVGIDITRDEVSGEVRHTARIGLVVPVYSDLDIQLDGDGGFIVTGNCQQLVFKPVSVQAMWSSLQCVISVRDTARANNYYANGLTHNWTNYYAQQLHSHSPALAEWHQMPDTESHLHSSYYNVSETAQLERNIRSKLKDLMMSVDLEEVTSKYLRQQLEVLFAMDLSEFRQFIDCEMITVMRQMDAPSQILQFLYLGSEWNASNFEELTSLGVGYILNVTREIDNFFPGQFEYCNVRVYDVEDCDLLKHWHRTYDFISCAR